VNKAIRLNHSAGDAVFRLLSACFSFMETVCKAVEKSVKALPALFLRYGAEDATKLAKWWEGKGKWLGKIAAGLVVIASGFKAWEKFSEGERALGILYGVSAFVAFLSIVLTGGFIGLALFALSIAIMVVIEVVEGDPFEKWMKKCWFGAGDKRFDSVNQELEEFSDAFKKVQVA
jgi:hypothetical protein